ncbi:hypothetical protein [Streptococcus mutans]|uniref:hypothetical protein n=1 Tax=Streptococcus mutans TaxID=1309 RepID=UPI001CFE7EDF|nr:hypothetical protein [Streptococcus mutans]MCB5030496.1 hypothetical protein [Streptococcus mutans]MCB5066779.1 hypothetical protein [Streptococcus mutans]MCB5069783.1 hypothetical protein [Streptococcus mutans]MDW5544234.1 hypothetical protein [Streptococcus mutans]MDW5547855.1 hypothetical protein [Streptococcus mutans]
MKKLTGFGIGFAVFIFFLNLIGCYDFVMVMTRNQTYFAEHYTSAVKAYFTNYPIFFVIVWFGSLSGGVLCPIFYLFRRKSALILAGLAFWGDAMLVLLTSLFRNRIQVFGWQFTFDLAILGLLGLYCLYLLKGESKSEKRN